MRITTRTLYLFSLSIRATELFPIHTNKKRKERKKRSAKVSKIEPNERKETLSRNVYPNDYSEYMTR